MYIPAWDHVTSGMAPRHCCQHTSASKLNIIFIVVHDDGNHTLLITLLEPQKIIKIYILKVHSGSNLRLVTHGHQCGVLTVSHSDHTHHKFNIFFLKKSCSSKVDCSLSMMKY